MPEASVDKNHRLILWQDNIRVSRQISSLQSKAAPHPVKQLANANLRGGIGAKHLRHNLASFLLIKHIWHGCSLRFKLNPQTGVVFYRGDNLIVFLNYI
jgi:hypothetical protein